MGDSPFGFESLGGGGGGAGGSGGAGGGQAGSSASHLQGFGDSPSPIPSIGETYNIHGTYAYLRDDSSNGGGGGGGGGGAGKSGDLISAFRDENTPAPTPGSPQDTKFSNTSMFHYGQAYQAFPDEISFMKQQGNFAVENNPDYYTAKQQQPQAQQPQQPVQAQQQQHTNSSGSSTGFPSPGPTDFQYPPDQKDIVFQNLSGFSANQNLFGDRSGYQGYQPGFYDNQRLTDTNFNFQLPHAGIYREGTGVNVHGRGPYQRRSSLTNPDR